MSTVADPYCAEWHLTRHGKTVCSARIIMARLLEMYPDVDSIVDVGCGVGTFLAVSGMTPDSIVGIDIHSGAGLRIPQRCYFVLDAGVSFRGRIPFFPDRFGMALCLEVAEHLPASKAHHLVDNLCLLSPLVVFSAAPPGQGGVGHVNEKPECYWDEMFWKRGYRPSLAIRRILKDEKGVLPWYRNNIKVYSK